MKPIAHNGRNLATAIALLVVLLYAGSYYCISRFTPAHAQMSYGRRRVFWYSVVGFDKLVHGRAWFGVHCVCYVVYYPANLIDTHLFGGPTALPALPMLRVGRPKRAEGT